MKNHENILQIYYNTKGEIYSMNTEIAVNIQALTKLYKLYDRTIDRLKETINFPSAKPYSKDFYALKDVSFTIQRGETVGILGKNGAGKSTLLKIITGVLNQTSGDAEVNGIVSALLELGAGFNPEYTGIENIYLNGAMMGMNRDSIDQKLTQILSFADIGDFVYQPVKTYSSGMFARLAFAVAISTEPDILIVDEALSVGDTRFQIKCMDYMKTLMEGGTTVLFVSHDINAIRRFCQRCIWLDHGELILDGDVNLVADAYSDFLKRDNVSASSYRTRDAKRRNRAQIGESIRKYNENCIAEITDFQVYDKNGLVGTDIYYDEPLTIHVVYEVYDPDVKDPVIGVAIRSADDDYTCGLNTLLDNVKIPWQQGTNHITLEFPCGIRAAGGDYYFEVAIEDQTATVGMHYIQRVQGFHMIMKYKCEGRYNIPHKWEVNNE